MGARARFASGRHIDDDRASLTHARTPVYRRTMHPTPVGPRVYYREAIGLAVAAALVLAFGVSLYAWTDDTSLYVLGGVCFIITVLLVVATVTSYLRDNARFLRDREFDAEEAMRDASSDSPTLLNREQRDALRADMAINNASNDGL